MGAIVIERFELNKEKLSEIIENNNYIGRGADGEVYQYNDDELIKIDKYYLSLFREDKNSAIDVFNRYGSQAFRCDVEKQQDKLASLKPYIKKSSFAKSLVYIESKPLALILKYHKAYKNLYDIALTYEEKERVFNLKIENLLELAANGIYHHDGTQSNNNLYNEENADLQLIDFEGRSLNVFDDQRLDAEEILYELLAGEYFASNASYVVDKAPYETFVKMAFKRRMNEDRFFEYKHRSDAFVKSLGVKEGKYRC